jgi:serine/threonine protein kinase
MKNDALIGQKLGEYQIVSLLGEGGMARVYKGYDERLDRFAAVKVIQPNQLATEDDDEYRERFLREARAIAKLHHPRVVSVYQFGELDNLYYMAMMFVEGRDLRQILKETNKQKKTLGHSQILSVVRDIADALDYSHQQGVIHRDVKPSNIMVTTEGGHSVLTDFGLALSAQEGTLGNTFGSVHYIAPEQAVSSAQAVPQSDLYSLSVVLYEMLTGRVPFDDVSAMSVALKHISDPPPPASMVNPAISPQIEDVLNKALDKDPTRRFSSGRALIHALEGAFAVSDDEDTHNVVYRETSLSKMAIPTEDRDRIPHPIPAESWDALSDKEDTQHKEPSRPIVLTALDSKTDLRLSTKSRTLAATEKSQPRRNPLLWVILGVILLAIGAFVVMNLNPQQDANDGDITAVALLNPTQSTAESGTIGVQDEETSTPVEVASSPDVPTSVPTQTQSADSVTNTVVAPTTTAQPTVEATLQTASSGDDGTLIPALSTEFEINAIALTEPALLLYYTPDQFVIYNRTASSVLQIDVRRLGFHNQRLNASFTSEAWSFNVSRWRMRPQLDCFQIIDSDLDTVDKPDFCTFLQAFERERNKFWVSNLADSTFDVLWDGAVVATCPVVLNNQDDEGVCFIELP